MRGLCIFLLISKTCPMLHAQVFLQSRYLLHCARLSSIATPRSGPSRRGGVCSALPSLSGRKGPSESQSQPSMRLAHVCTNQHFQEFCLPQTWSDSGASLMPWLQPGPRGRRDPQATQGHASLAKPCLSCSGSSQTWWLSNHFVSCFL